VCRAGAGYRDRARMPPRRLKPNRTGTYLSLAFGAVCAVLGVAILAAGSLVGIFPLILAAIGVYGGVGGLVPGVGLLLDGQGFRLKSFGKSWGAQWLEIDGFTPTKVRVGRRSGDVDVVEIHYAPGVGDRHLPHSKLGETLGVDERYLIAAYGGLSNVDLAALLERYRTGG
jgi:hypothetical protein